MNVLQDICRHHQGFTFLSCSCADRLPGVWACNVGCGFAMNFDPEKFPAGIAYVVTTRNKPGLKLAETEKPR